MSDNLVLYGSTYSNVAGFKAKNTSNTQLTFVRPQGSLNINTNDTYDVTQYASAVVSVSGGSDSNDFVISISYNSTTEMWELDKTFLEIQSAYNAGKNLVSYCEEYLLSWISYIEGDSDDLVVYVVLDDNVTPALFKGYSLTSQGTVLDYEAPYQNTSNATVTANDLLDGIVAFGSTGAVIGTIPTKTASDLTVSGATVTAPAGYYAAAATKSVNAGSATTPNSTLATSPSISISNSGLITAAVSGSTSITPTISAGYVSTGTAGTVNVSGSSTYQLSTVSASTISPTESQQTAVAANKYTLGEIKVGAIPATYVGSGVTQRSISSGLIISSDGIATVLNGYWPLVQDSNQYKQLDTLASTTITPSNSQQTIGAAGKFMKGAITVNAMPSGTLAAPTASKGSVSNHSISVTPSVQVTSAGYLATTTKTGTAVSVSASELVSGSTTISSNGTYDVTNLASAVVSLSFASISTGTSNPSGGSNGDIYIKVVS